ncbi:hypothetical protein AAFF_G00229840 [Aldrovandia affinis]|uniref:Uncharacterized protein n=1 Tax=Aldrovandia affinis TaxID=143900 RepID=A0AAD7SVT8_9TELE|nr:hypothetical protein AAFF_G00229840 [Aldrovandia affinis]
MAAVNGKRSGCNLTAKGEGAAQREWQSRGRQNPVSPSGGGRGHEAPSQSGQIALVLIKKAPVSPGWLKIWTLSDFPARNGSGPRRPGDTQAAPDGNGDGHLTAASWL